jgi:hypothetical protein
VRHVATTKMQALGVLLSVLPIDFSRDGWVGRACGLECGDRGLDCSDEINRRLAVQITGML